MARGRRIPHTHVFLVPTRPGDVLDRYFNGLGNVQEGSQELAPLREPASRDDGRAPPSRTAAASGHGVRRRGGEEALDRAREALERDRLDEVLDESRFAAAPEVVFHPVAGHGNPRKAVGVA